ncbi:LADA_0H12332g1_1 [Lachancea dasiensis]|uniref:LADA_0H12332g1_1 n=1 Tax=Lachancea dasiensis TaxID=1072105 RepID=A0A1G4K3R6_9SACH|nr:LADA_0H12332g1_1 [Lachancea dasiensis]
MYKLQVVLVPPGSPNGAFPFLSNPATTESSQVLPSTMGANGSAILTGNRPEMAPSGGSNNNLFMSSFISNHIPQPKLKKFLHFTKPTNSLLALAEEIVDKCDKIYPSLVHPVELSTLQDSNDCDLDPDFLVQDVFNVDNVVRAVLRHDIELTDDQSPTLYSVKRRRLNTDAAKIGPANGALGTKNTTNGHAGGGQSSTLHVAKKRPHILRNSTAMRVSTPLANQIYPPPSGRQVNSDYEDDDFADRSILPPPKPQSQSIRISSGIESSAKKINFKEDTISKSESVDPDKSRQQRLPSGTPKRQSIKRFTTTPKRSNDQGLLLATTEEDASTSATPMVTNKRITSGMLRIPEPKISEVEKELRQGPASPSAILPARSERLPTKKPEFPRSDEDDQSQSSSEESPVASNLPINLPVEPAFKLAASRQTSIADNNGSPMKDGSKIGNVNLAELPSSGRKRVTRKSSLESKVDSLIKHANALPEKGREDSKRVKEDTISTTRKDTFSDDDETDGRQEQQDPNETVRVNNLDNIGNNSFHKSELLSMLKGNKFDIPSDFNTRSLRSKGGYLENSADKSSSDAKEIINQRIQRSAAIKAAELLSSGKSRNREPTSESEEESSDIETDGSENEKVTVLENQALKRLNIHPLKERVIGEGLEKIPTAETSAHSRGARDTAEQNIDRAGATDGSKQDDAPGASTKKSDLIDRKKYDAPPNMSTSKVREPTSASSNDLGSLSLATKTRSAREKNGSDSPTDDSNLTKSKNSPSKDEISSNLVKGITPQPANNGNKAFQSAEFIEDSDDDDNPSTNTSIQKSDTLKKLPPSVLKRREEADRKRKEKEALKKLREEEHARKKAEKEAKRKEKNEAAERKKIEREERKRLKEEEAAKKRKAKVVSKGYKSNSKLAAPEKKDKQVSKPVDPSVNDKGQREHAAEEQNAEWSSSNAKNNGGGQGTGGEAGGLGDREDRGHDPSLPLEPHNLARYFNTGDKAEGTQGTQALSIDENQGDESSKLQQMKSHFASRKKTSPENEKKNEKRLSHGTIQRDSPSSLGSEIEISDAGSSSEGDDSEDLSSDEEVSNTNKKSRRGIVDTPKGMIVSLPNRAKASDISGLENAPQSTQQVASTQQLDSPNRVPVTRLMEMSSPSSAVNGSPTKGAKKPQAMPSRSLSSLSDLVSRGVPEVKEVSSKASQAPATSKGDSSGGESQNDSGESGSDDSDSDDSSDDDSSNFISAKSASKALGRQRKSNSGFASLVKDSKKH